MGKTIHIHVHQTRDAGEWEESKHPRAENGQFGKGSGNGTKPLPGAGNLALKERQAAKKAASEAKATQSAKERTMMKGRGLTLAASQKKTEARKAIASGGHQPGSHQYHQAKADEMRGMSRPYSSEHANLQLTTLHHHQNAATAIKRLETAQGTEHRRQLKEQADFHMKGAAEGEKQMQAAGLLKKPVNAGSNGGSGTEVQEKWSALHAQYKALHKKSAAEANAFYEKNGMEELRKQLVGPKKVASEQKAQSAYTKRFNAASALGDLMRARKK